MQLLERLSQFSDILASAKTSSVGQWNLEYLKNVIQCAIDVENEVSKTSEEEIKIVYQKLVSKASNERRVRPFDFQEFKSAFYSLYGTLLKNGHLSSELVSFLIDTYNFPLEDLSSIKDNISEDIQHFVKPLVTFELLVNIENILSDGLYQIKCQSAQSAQSSQLSQSARNLYQNNKLSAIKHEFSYKLSLTTNTNRSAARILLQDLLKFFQNCQLLVDDSIERIKSDLHNYATRLKGGMEIIIHAAILSKQESDRNFPELNYIILDWITSIVVEDADKKKILSSDNLKHKIWSLHPWLLTQLSLIHQPFFEVYLQILIQCIQQEQQYMLGKFSIELIQPKLFYQLSNLSNEMVLHYNNNCKVNKSNYQRLEGLLIHWELFLNIDNIGDNIVYLLQQEWMTFKKRYENYEQTQELILFTQMWKYFFLKLGIQNIY